MIALDAVLERAQRSLNEAYWGLQGARSGHCPERYEAQLGEAMELIWKAKAIVEDVFRDRNC